MITLSFEPSVSTDVVGYNMYIDKNTLSFTSMKYDLGNNLIVNLADILPIDTNGIYNIGVSAYDELGNESSIVFTSGRIDFSVPEPPKNISLKTIAIK